MPTGRGIEARGRTLHLANDLAECECLQVAAQSQVDDENSFCGRGLGGYLQPGERSEEDLLLCGELREARDIVRRREKA